MMERRIGKAFVEVVLCVRLEAHKQQHLPDDMHTWWRHAASCIWQFTSGEKCRINRGKKNCIIKERLIQTKHDEHSWHLCNLLHVRAHTHTLDDVVMLKIHCEGRKEKEMSGSVLFLECGEFASHWQHWRHALHATMLTTNAHLTINYHAVSITVTRRHVQGLWVLLSLCAPRRNCRNKRKEKLHPQFPPDMLQMPSQMSYNSLLVQYFQQEH